MIDKFGGRKVVVVGMTVIVGVALVLWKGDVPANFLSLLEWAVGFFVIGNGIEHGCATYSQVNTSSDDDIVTQFIGKLDESLGKLTEQDGSLANQQKLLTDQQYQLADQQGATQQAVVTIQQMLAAICKKYNI